MKQTAFSSSIRHISLTLLFCNVNIKQVCEHPFNSRTDTHTCSDRTKLRWRTPALDVLQKIFRQDSGEYGIKTCTEQTRIIFWTNLVEERRRPEVPSVPKTSADQMGHKLLAHSSVRSFGGFKYCQAEQATRWP